MLVRLSVYTFSCTSTIVVLFNAEISFSGCFCYVYCFVFIRSYANSNHHHHHHHHVVPPSRISLNLSRHFSLSFIASGRSSGLHTVSSHSCCMFVRAGRPAFARPYAGVHRSTSLMSSSLLHQQCPTCLVRLTWIFFVQVLEGTPTNSNKYSYLIIKMILLYKSS